MRHLFLIPAALFLSIGFVHSQDSLKPDEAPIRYVDAAPEEGTPQAVMVNFIRLREDGRIEEAGKMISKKCPDWLRESMLKSESAERGPIKIETLTYQLMEFTPEKAKVNVSFNYEKSGSSSWTRSLIREDGKWVLR